MKINVTFEFESFSKVMDFMESLDPEITPEPSVTGVESSPKPRRGRPPKAAAADPTPAAPAASPAAPAASSAAAAPVAAVAPAAAPTTASLVPFSALVEPLTQLADTNLEAAMAILATYGVKTARELKPEQFGPVLAEVNAALVPKAAARPSLI